MPPVENYLNIELARDLINFQELNQKSYAPTAEEADLNAASQRALYISREHLDHVANYFSTQLEKITLSFNQNSISFHFQDRDEVAETLKLCIRQTVEPLRAERTAYLTINSMLQSFGRPSAFKDDSENISATLLVAATIDSYRRILAKELANSQSDRKVFGIDDQRLIQDLALIIGKQAQHQEFTDFRDISEEIQACAVGVVVDGHRIVIASLVGSYSQEGFIYSVRDYKNERIPGRPDFFPSLSQAIVAHQNYFLAIANSLRKMKKPWWKRVF